MRQKVLFPRLLTCLLMQGMALTVMAQTVAISYSAGDAMGLSPQTEYVSVDSEYTVKKNFTFYKEGMTFTNWYDTNSGTTYTPGQKVKASAALNLTPRFKTNTVSLADRTEEVRVRFSFLTSDGAPVVNWSSTNKAVWVTQVTVKGVTIDVPAFLNITDFLYTDKDSWGYLGTGTIVTVPSCKGATMAIGKSGWDINDHNLTTKFDGNDRYVYSEKLDKAFCGISSQNSTIDILIGNCHGATDYLEIYLPKGKPKASPAPEQGGAYADKYDACVNGIYYNLIKKAKRATVMHVGNDEGTFYGNVVIPETIDFDGTTYNVVEINKGAFSGCAYLLSLTIPSNVTKIGWSCTHWSVNKYSGGDIPMTNLYVSSLGYWFNDVEFDNGNPISNATLFYADNRDIVNLAVPDGVKTIKPGLFKEYSGLHSVSFPQSVKTIGLGAFDSCDHLETVTISSSVDSIASYAFEDCVNLTKVNIADMAAWCNIVFGGSGLSGSPTSSRDPFCRAPKRASSDGIPSFDGCNPLENENASLYLNGIEVKDLVIPEGVKTVCGLAFAKYNKLRSVTMPNSVDSIGPAAFACCDALTEVKFSNTLKTIGGDANYTKYGSFAYCTNLKSISLPNSLKTIKGSAFYGCTSLASLSIPNSVTFLGNEAFKGCTSLTSITIPGSIIDSNGGRFSGCTGLKSVTIADGANAIGSRDFYGCTALTSVNIPNSVTAIEESAFEGCTSLKSISIPNSVKILEPYAFRRCENLTTVILGHGIVEIWDAAFGSCKELTDLFCYAHNVPHINSRYAPYYGERRYAFDDSEVEWATLHVPASAIESYKAASYWNDFGTIVALKEGDPGYSNMDKTTISFADASVKAICLEKWDLDANGQLSMYEASQVKDLGSAFKGTNITTFNELKYFTSIKSVNFSGCTSLTSVTIPSSMTTIEYAFVGCTSLTSVTIPSSVTSIGKKVFYGCSGLTSFTIPNSVTDIGSEAFANCSGLTSVTIPNSVTNIGTDAFLNCTSLTSVTIPSSMTSIGTNVFAACYGMTSVNIPNSVTSIGKEAFQYCSGLTSVTIPSSVKSIGEKAFEDCSGLKEVCSQIEQPFTIQYNVFRNSYYNSKYDRGYVFTSATLYVPRGTKALYEATEGWKEFKTIIETDFNEQPKGDLNLDSQVNGTDVVALVNVIMQGGSNSAADVNGDGKVNGTDIVALVNIVMQTSLSREMAVAGSRGGEEAEDCNATAAIGAALTPTGTDGSQELAISLTNPAMEVTMVQMNVTLPEGVTLDDDAAMMGGRTTGRSHQLYASHLDERTVRLLLVSGHNALIAGTEGDIVRLPLTVGDGFQGGDIVVDHALCTSPDQTEAWPQAVVLHLAEDGTMGIGSVGMAAGENVNVHSLTGQRLTAPRKGVNIVNGKKIIVK